MFAIFDTFNEKVISRHRTVREAVKANNKFQAAVKRNNGHSSYIPVELRIVSKDKLVKLDPDSQEQEEWICGDNI